MRHGADASGNTVGNIDAGRDQLERFRMAFGDQVATCHAEGEIC